MSARIFIIWLFLVASANLMADEAGYRLWIETTVRNNLLTVVPHITAPAPATLRYEIVSTKEGKSGSSSTTQSGRVALDREGSRALATLSLGVGAKDWCSIVVKVFDGKKVVAEKTFTYPE